MRWCERKSVSLMVRVMGGVLAGTLFPLAPSAIAQERWTYGRADTSRVAQAEAPRYGNASRPQAGERDAVQVYADARYDMEAGRFRDAERRLEYLISRFPDSAIAEIARRDLKGFYGRLGDSDARVTAPAQDVVRRTTALPPPYGLGGDVGRGMPPSTAPFVVQQPSVPSGGRTAPPRAPIEVQITRPAALSAQGLPGQALPAQVGQALRAPVREATSAAVVAASDAFKSTVGDRIFFSNGSADIGSRGRAALDAQAGWLHRHLEVAITVEGHADDGGAGDFNQTIAQRRAEVVRQRLIEAGVAETRIGIVAAGRSQPVVDCRDPECAAQNRRAVSVVTSVTAAGGQGRDAASQELSGAIAGDPVRGMAR